MKPRLPRILFFIPICTLALLAVLFVDAGNLSFASLPNAHAASNLMQAQQDAELDPVKDDSSDKDPPVQAAGEEDSAWLAWSALPDTIKEKVDPRIIAELRGDIKPVHLGGDLDYAELAPHERLPVDEQPDQTRFLVYLQEQPDIPRVKAEAEKLVAAAAAEKEIAASGTQAAPDQSTQGQAAPSQAAPSQAVPSQAVAQRTAVVNTLVATTQQSQAAMRSALELQLGAGEIDGYHSFFIVNAVAVDGGLRSLIELAKRPDVDHIAANYSLVPLWDITQKTFEQGSDFETDLAPNWNILKVGADRVWSNLDVLGQGAVVAGFDTGVEYQHPALVDQYRGNLGNDEFDHNYSWFEPDGDLYPDGNLGASASTVPADCAYYSTHGTHTMGTMVGNATGSGGNAGTSNQVGMAPRARWIAVPGICYNTMPGGMGDDIGGLKAFQWLLCPTDLSGDLSTADCSKAPDVINNSWGSANPFSNVFEPVVDALRAAGIASVFAAGNPSAGPGSIGSPASIPSGITVGATDYKDDIASFSAQGPSIYEGVQKPELSAPGVDVRSSIYSQSYDSYSGTSMAAPHVAGLVALMISADLQDGVRDFNIDELQYFMEATAIDLGAPGADPIYGHGRIDAYRAVQWVAEAGDLRGTVYDAESGEPISNARAVGSSSVQTFVVDGGATGTYSLTVPIGTYDITVDAWGYAEARFPNQAVFPRSLSIADFSLSKLPTNDISGIVQTGEKQDEAMAETATLTTLPQPGLPVANAMVMVQDHPQISTTTAADGSFALTLPTGDYVLAVEAAQHRFYTMTVSVTDDGAQAALTLTPEAAPSILLVHADGHSGWFFGWPVYPLVEKVLQNENYLYDLWLVEDLDIEEAYDPATYESVDGTIRHGIPTTQTLATYDVVIWLNSGCGTYYCNRGGSPKSIGAEDELIGYLEGGGRLILSGQNIGSASDGNSALFDDYLFADLVDGSAAGEGDIVFGNDFMSGLSLEVTNAALYGYRNGVLDLSPDGVLPQEDSGSVVPVLSYENGSGAAALAVSPCGQDYRALYFSVGYESLGPRGAIRNADFNRVLDGGIDWLLAEKQDYSISMVAEEIQQTSQPGSEVTYRVRVLNTGREEASVQLSLDNETAQWVTLVYEEIADLEAEGEENEATTLTELSLVDPLVIAPCAVRTITLVTDIPESAENGAFNAQSVTATLLSGPAAGTADALAVDVTLTTRSFVQWALAGRAEKARVNASAISEPNGIHFYLLGGNNDDYYSYSSYSALNQRYNVCTNEWEELAPLPIGKRLTTEAVLNGKIYLFGGRDSSYDYWYSYGADVSDDVQIYDIATDTWSVGAPVPVLMRAATAAVADGKIYLFGGKDGTSDLATTYMYDPLNDTWLEKEPMPGGERSYAAAATAPNGKIYVANGSSGLNRLEVYDPLTDLWEQGAASTFGREGGSLTLAPDGYLYAVGGVDSYDVPEPERYNPETDSWETISSLNKTARNGSSVAYVAGRLFVIGGYNGDGAIETLTIDDSFCLSSASALRGGTEPGGRLSYRVEIVPDSVALATVEVSAMLPLSTTFAGFGDNGAGASFNEATNQVEWSGALTPNMAPLTFTYDVQLENIEWANGATIPTYVRFENSSEELSTGPVFTSTILGRVYQPDLSASYVSTARELAIVGEELLYTVNLRSTTTAGGGAAIKSVLPAGLEYVDESLIYETGNGSYDAATRAILWNGTLSSDLIESVNNSDDFAWIDSDGNVSNVASDKAIQFEWEDVKESGTFLVDGDDSSTCDVEIGFAFTYYGESHTTLCVDTNGRIFFSSYGYSERYNSCPLGGAYAGDAIAVLWDDLVVRDGIYSETLGVAPNRYMVVQWAGVDKYSYGSDGTIEFQAILYETGELKIQILKADYMTGSTSTTGVSGYDASASVASGGGVTYACNEEDSLKDNLAILFVPPGAGIGRAATDVSYAVKVSTEVPFNTTLTNTVAITAANGVFFTRTVNARFNPISIEADATVTDQDDPGSTTGNGSDQVSGVSIGGPMDYQFVLRNSGPLTATNVLFTFPIDEVVTYLPDSVNCTGGDCRREEQQIIWDGSIAPSSRVTVTFSAILETPLEDATLVEGTAVINDGTGQIIEVTSAFQALSSKLTATVGRQITTFSELGTEVWYELYVRNIGHSRTEAMLDLIVPPGLTYVEDSLLCGRGFCEFADSTIQWAGTISPRDTIPVRFAVLVPAEGIYGQQFQFNPQITDQIRQEQITVETASIVVARNTQLPLMFSIRTIEELFLPFIAQE